MPSHIKLLATNEAKESIAVRLRETLSKLTERNCSWMNLDTKLHEGFGVTREILDAAVGDIEVNFDITITRDFVASFPAFSIVIDCAYEALVARDDAVFLAIFAAACEQVADIPAVNVLLNKRLLLGLGIDSFTLFDVLDVIKDEHSLDVPYGELYNAFTVQDVLNKLKDCCQKA